MVRSYLAVAGIAVASIGVSLLESCSGTTTTGGTGGVTHAAPPPAPMGAKPGDGTGSVTFAISKLYLGDTDPNGKEDKTGGWKNFGYDLDGKISTAESTDLCQVRPPGMKSNVYPDGLNGIDNAFGKIILQIIMGFDSTPSASINQSIQSGKFTVMFDMQKLGAGTDYDPLTTNLFGGGDLMGMPKFDGTDRWPVTPDLLNDGKTIASGSKVSFPSSYLTNNTWVSGSKGDVTLELTILTVTLNLTISNAVISMQLDPTHKTATKGVIAGVLKTDALTAQIKELAGNISSTLCDGPTVDGILTQIAAASDILSDGTQDPSKTCDGISIGIGFEASVVQLGDVLMPMPPPPSKCSSSSSSGSGGSGTGGSGTGGSGSGGSDGGPADAGAG
jgi:uncharacterized membrane protein YgcG